MPAFVGVARADTCFCAGNYSGGGRMGAAGDCLGCCPPTTSSFDTDTNTPSLHPHPRPALLGGVITVAIIIHASQRCSHAGRDVDAHKQAKVSRTSASPRALPHFCNQTKLSVTQPCSFSRTKSLLQLSASATTPRTCYCRCAAGLLLLSCCGRF